MISKDLEAKLIDALTTALETLPERQDVHIFGAWQPSLAGTIKNAETAAAAAVVYVALGTMQRQTFTAPTASITGAVTLTVRFERDVTGNMFFSIAERIEALLLGWQGEAFRGAFTALDVPGYSVGDIDVQGGSAPELASDAHTLSVSWPFTIHGTET